MALLMAAAATRQPFRLHQHGTGTDLVGPPCTVAQVCLWTALNNDSTIQPRFQNSGSIPLQSANLRRKVRATHCCPDLPTTRCYSGQWGPGHMPSAHPVHNGLTAFIFHDVQGLLTGSPRSELDWCGLYAGFFQHVFNACKKKKIIGCIMNFRYFYSNFKQIVESMWTLIDFFCNVLLNKLNFSNRIELSKQISTGRNYWKVKKIVANLFLMFNATYFKIWLFSKQL